MIREMCPNVYVACHAGRRGILNEYFQLNLVHILSSFNSIFIHSGSFEVQINDQLVHSKLNSLSFPDYGDVLKNVKLAAEGEPVSKVKEQPITDCVIQ